MELNVSTLVKYRSLPSELNKHSSPAPPIDASKRLIAPYEPAHFFPRVQGKSVGLEYLSPETESSSREFLSIELYYLNIPSPIVHTRDVGGLPVAPLAYLILRQLLKWDATRFINTTLPALASNAINFMLALSLSTAPDDNPLDMTLHYSSRAAVDAYLVGFPIR